MMASSATRLTANSKAKQSISSVEATAKLEAPLATARPLVYRQTSKLKGSSKVA